MFENLGNSFKFHQKHGNSQACEAVLLNNARDIRVVCTSASISDDGAICLETLTNVDYLFNLLNQPCSENDKIFWSPKI